MPLLAHVVMGWVGCGTGGGEVVEEMVVDGCVGLGVFGDDTGGGGVGVLEIGGAADGSSRRELRVPG